MSEQAVEIFFPPPPDMMIEAVVLPIGTEDPRPRHVAFAFRLVGRLGALDDEIGRNWQAVVICTPEFSKQHRATPERERPRGTALKFCAPS